MSAPAEQTAAFSADESCAHALDAADPLAPERDLFHIPPGPDGSACVYLAGNSLGLQPKAARAMIEQELDDWARLGVDAHVEGQDPWLSYHEQFRESAARLIGALPGEAVLMNSLTVNVHLMMVSFYRPTPTRNKILIEGTSFPSDSYAVATQVAHHGFDPRESVIRLEPRAGESTLRTDDIINTINDRADEIALVHLGAVNYLTGQWFEMERITEAAHAKGCTVGWDLAHAAGNVPLKLHDWGVDFATWCTYKYLNSGPGAVAGAFVHEKHGRDTSINRFAGWWGNDPATRFEMGPDFVPRPGADGWQISNPPIMAMAPIKASMDVFDRVGMDAIRAKSLAITGYMERLIDRLCGGRVEILTPREPDRRGAQLSLCVPGKSKDLQAKLHERGVVVDYREPDIIRAAPAPLYVSYHDVWRFVRTLGECT